MVMTTLPRPPHVGGRPDPIDGTTPLGESAPARGYLLDNARAEAGERFVPDVIRSTIDQATAMVTGDRPPTIGEVVLRRLDDLEADKPTVDAVPLPRADTHRLLAGLRPGQLVVIGARPGVARP